MYIDSQSGPCITQYTTAVLAVVWAQSVCDVTNSYALGMESRAISDYQISASDYLRSAGPAMPPYNARLNYITVTGIFMNSKPRPLQMSCV